MPSLPTATVNGNVVQPPRQPLHSSPTADGDDQHSANYATPLYDTFPPHFNPDDPQSPQSSPFSIRSHKLREAQLTYQSLSPTSPGALGSGGTPYYDAEGDALFGPSPGNGWAPLPSPGLAASASAPPGPDHPPSKVADSIRSSIKSAELPAGEKTRLREKYGLDEEKEKMLERLMGVIWKRAGKIEGAHSGEPANGEAGSVTRRSNGSVAKSIGSVSPPSPSSAISPIPSANGLRPPLNHENTNLVSLPASPPATRSSSRLGGRRKERERSATIEGVLATAATPEIERAPTDDTPSDVTRRDDIQLRAETAQQSSQSPLLSPRGPSLRSPRGALSRSPESNGAEQRQRHSPTSSPASLHLDDAASPPTSLRLDHAASPTRSSPLYPASLHHSSPPQSPRDASLGPPVLSPKSPRDERSLTPFPSPPAPAPNFFPDPSRTRPKMYQQLGYDYLPSRNGVRAQNRVPQIDSEMSEEEKDWLHRTRRVVNDGRLKDWWGHPVGVGHQWGKAVLSPLLSETEKSHSSPSYSSHCSPPHSYQPFFPPSSPHRRPAAAVTSPRSVSSSTRLARSPLAAEINGVSSPHQRTASAGAPERSASVQLPLPPLSQYPSVTSSSRRPDCPPVEAPTATVPGPSQTVHRASKHSPQSPTKPAVAPRAGESTRARSANEKNVKADLISSWAQGVADEREVTRREGRSQHQSSPAVRPSQSGGDEIYLDAVEERVPAVSAGGNHRSLRAPAQPNVTNTAKRKSYPSVGYTYSTLPSPDKPRPLPSGRNAEDIVSWARTAGGNVEHDSPTRPVETSPAGSPPKRNTPIISPRSPPSPTKGGAPGSKPSAGKPDLDLGGSGGQLSLGDLVSERSPPSRLRSRTFSDSAALLFSPPRTNGSLALDDLPRLDTHTSHLDALTAAPPDAQGGEGAPGLTSNRTRGASRSGRLENSLAAGEDDDTFLHSPLSALDGIRVDGPRRILKPYRRGPFPVPVFSEEEKEERRRLRKTGRSPEYDLEMRETKAERRKQAWKEQHVFEHEQTRLRERLGHPSSAADIPVLNALARLHLKTTVPSTRASAEQYMLHSLAYDEAQPEIAHLLACELERRNSDEATHWHRIAVQYGGAAEPEYYLELAAAFLRAGYNGDAIDAYSALRKDFTDSPYEALALLHLGRLYQDIGQPEDNDTIRQTYDAALDKLQRLKLTDPLLREGGRWDELELLEANVLANLAELDREELGAAGSARTNNIDHEGVSPVSQRRPYTSAPTTPVILNGHRPPSAPPALRLDSPPRMSGSPPSQPVRPPPEISRSAPRPPAPRAPSPTARLYSNGDDAVPRPSSQFGHLPARPSSAQCLRRPRGASEAHTLRLSQMYPYGNSRTIDMITRSLQDMSRSNATADLAKSSKLLVDKVDEAYNSLKALSEEEAAKQQEFADAIGHLHTTIQTLPGRLISAAKLMSARPAWAPPPPEPNTLEIALAKLEKARSSALLQ
ncbi:hypothetical protein JCM11641_002123 [Rhodosporidiobolus odoratus]